MFAGTLENWGPPVSETVTLKLPVAVLLGVALSLALQFTVVEPIANVEPDAGLHETATDPETRSVALAAYVTTAPALEVAETLMSEGRLRLGAVVSCTVTLNVACDVLVDASDAVQLTVVSPKWKVDPEAGLQRTVGLGSVSSVALAENVTAAPDELVASAVMSPGTVSTGGVVSGGGGGGTYVTVTVALAVLAPSLQKIVVSPGSKCLVTLNSGAGPPSGVQVTSTAGSS